MCEDEGRPGTWSRALQQRAAFRVVRGAELFGAEHCPTSCTASAARQRQISGQVRQTRKCEGFSILYFHVRALWHWHQPQLTAIISRIGTYGGGEWVCRWGGGYVQRGRLNSGRLGTVWCVSFTSAIVISARRLFYLLGGFVQK